MLCSVVTACASTSITQSWKQEELQQSYKRPLIIGLSDSQQTRRIFENQLVAELKKANVTAIPSYTLISSKQSINRETVINTIQDTDIDCVLVTYLTSANTEVKYRDSPITASYSGNAENNMMSETLITNRGRFSDEEIITLKNDLYSVQSQSIVWSVQTETVAAKSIDEIIIDVSELLVAKLLDDEIFK